MKIVSAFVETIFFYLVPIKMKLAQIYECFLKSDGVSTDSRSIRSGQMFFALSGENFNGNKFALSALEKEASYVIIDQEIELHDDRVILVEDTLSCLQRLASLHKTTLGTPVIAITGSNGKTTTKELCHAVLSTQYECHYTKGNLNNHIGVPLTLLELNKKHELAIVEMGANHINEIYPLCQIAKPDFGIITNIGKAHLEGFGSIEGVKKGKGELFDYLKETNGIIFYNGEDKKLLDLVGEYEKAIQYFPSGLSVKEKNEGLLNFVWDNKEVFTHLTGDYNVFNIAAAIFLGAYFKISNENIQFAISEYKPTNNRSQRLIQDGIEYFLDAYNANPTSMKLSLDNFLSIQGEEKILVLGDMLELGGVSKQEHQAIIDYLLKQEFSSAFVVGEEFEQVDIEDERVTHYRTVNELKLHLKTHAFHKPSKVYLKGSRGIGLEKLLD